MSTTETEQPANVPEEGRRCGFVTVLGPTNAGKSTLVNALVGTKIAIVSHKVQTTRAPIRGILTEGSSQIVFTDTAGIFNPKRRLDRAMIDAAWGGIEDADVILLVIDAATDPDDDTMKIVERLKSAKSKRIAVLNKVDRVEDKTKLLKLAEKLDGALAFDKVFMISALEGKGVTDLKKHLLEIVPEGPWHYAEDDVTDVPMRTQAAEMTRESIYRFLHQELPYTTTVETLSWKTLKDGSARVEQTIYVERDGQKKIVLGKGGATIKKISSSARKAIEEMAGHRIHLFLFVKVRENWESDPERYREMGLPFPKS
ncbi:GTPase Era [Hyphomicrobium methylovorum]|uniref:GTPase Era n=1 Tax=Hyphomicrobium methylovorum TaxID=84 RepID=UPI0015E7B5F1|nr:GTPase Era [Hyphomicrobium methylovorum]MBA2125260.1 GTPase Era [Hyphomicrobium methylovorum]